MNDNPWDRIRGESPVAYAAFLIYRDLGRSRSLAEAQRIHTAAQRNKKGAKTHGCGTWSGKYEWLERCRAWDNHLQQERDKVAIDQARKWEARRLENQEANYELAQKLRARANDLLGHPIVEATGKTKDGAIIVKPAGWTQKDVAAIARVAADLASMALASPVLPPQPAFEPPDEVAQVDQTPLVDDPDEMRRLELHRLDLIYASLWEKVMMGDLRAAETAMKVMQMRVKYLGITPPAITSEGESLLLEQFGHLAREAYPALPVPDEGAGEPTPPA